MPSAIAVRRKADEAKKAKSSEEAVSHLHEAIWMLSHIVGAQEEKIKRLEAEIAQRRSK